jgi:lysophospholipase L1-like esterase
VKGPLIIAVVGDSLSLPLKRSLRFSEALIDDRDMLVAYPDTFPAIMQLTYTEALATPVLVTSQTQRGATTAELPQLLATTQREYQPHYVVVSIGTSDARFRTTGLRRAGGALWQKIAFSEFEKNLMQLLPVFMFSRARLITLGILPCSSELLRKYPSTPTEFDIYNSALQRFTSQAGGVFVDMTHLAESIDEYVAPDGFHYNTRAHKRVAEDVLRIIKDGLHS